MGRQCKEQPVPAGESQGAGRIGVAGPSPGTGRYPDSVPVGAGGTEGDTGRPGGGVGPLWVLGGSHRPSVAVWGDGSAALGQRWGPGHCPGTADGIRPTGAPPVVSVSPLARVSPQYRLGGVGRSKEAAGLPESTGRGGLRKENCRGDGRQGAYWCRKALDQGLRHLDTGQEQYKTTSRLERLNRELRRREKLGTVWSPYNLPALLEIRGLINQTT